MEENKDLNMEENKDLNTDADGAEKAAEEVKPAATADAAGAADTEKAVKAETEAVKAEAVKAEAVKAEAEVAKEVKPEAKPEVKPEAKPEVKPEAKPEVKPEAKPEVKPEIKPEAGNAKPETQKIDKKIIKIVAIILGVIAVGLLIFFLFFYKSKAVRDTEDMIDAIGEVTLYSGDMIEEAEEMYASLTDKEKGQVENIKELEEARDLYTELCDKDAAYQVDLLIDAIGEVDRYSEGDIEAARDAYDALTKKQKQYVEKLDVLEKAEEDFELVDVRECEELINKIQDAADSPEIELPIAIEAARTAYDALSSSHKKLVSNYSNLETAEKAYDEYTQKKDALKIQKEHEERLANREKYMDSCQAVTYAQLISNPETYEGKDIAIKVDILSVEAAKFLKSGAIVARPAGGRTDNVISLIDGRKVKEPEFTEGATLTVYGEFNGANTITSYVEGSGLLGTNLFAEVDTETLVPEINVIFTSTDDTKAIDEKPTTTEIFNYVEEGIDIAKDVTDILKKFIP